jgi:hypothetical protein
MLCAFRSLVAKKFMYLAGGAEWTAWSSVRTSLAFLGSFMSRAISSENPRISMNAQ